MAKFAFISPYDQCALGVRYLSAVLKRAGHSVRIIILKDVINNRDPENLKVDSGYSGAITCCSDREYGLVCDLLREFDADFIGVSLASQCFGLGAWMSDKLKRDFPRIPLIWGGVDPTLHPELGIEHCDFLAVGEGEESLPELVATLREGRDPSRLDGFWVRNGGSVHRNPARPLIQDLDRIPFPDFEPGEKFLVQNNQVQPLTEPWYIMLTQRGCPYRCSYCINSALPSLYPKQKYLRRRSVANVMDELHWIRGLYPGLGYIAFFDDIFTLNKNWLREFGPRYRDEIGLPFWCYTYPGLCDDETATILKDMGVEHVHVGIQSGSERILKEVYHRPSIAKVKDTAQILERRGIRVRYDIIAGNPLEADEDHLATLEVLLDLPQPFRITPTNPLCMVFNSPITRMVKEKGIALTELKGVNGYISEEDTHFRFWRTIFDLTQYPILDKDFVRSLARDEHLKAHPDVVEAFQRALVQSYWQEPGGFVSRKEQAQQLQVQMAQLAAERDALRDRLAAIEGKRLYKLYQKIKGLFSGTK